METCPKIETSVRDTVDMMTSEMVSFFKER